MLYDNLNRSLQAMHLDVITNVQLITLISLLRLYFLYYGLITIYLCTLIAVPSTIIKKALPSSTSVHLFLALFLVVVILVLDIGFF